MEHKEQFKKGHTRTVRERNGMWIDGRTVTRNLIKGKPCKHCGNKKNIDSHHLEPAEYEPQAHSPKKGNHGIDNIIPLCRSCHRKEHNKHKPKKTRKSNCIYCGKEFTYLPSVQYGKYCSREHYLNHRWGK